MKKSNLVKFGVALVIVVMTCTITSCSLQSKKEGEKSKETIKIGSIMILSGNLAFLGQPFSQGMELAVNEINASGGINGQLIELVIEDSKGDPKEGVTIVNNMAARGDLDAVVIYSTAVSQAVAPILEENKIPFIAHGADTGLPMNFKYAFKSFYNSYEDCKKLVEYTTQKNGMEKYALLLPQTPWGEWCYKGASEVAGADNVVDLRYKFGEMDFRTLLLKAKQNKVDAIVTGDAIRNYADEQNKQKAEMGITTPFICGPKSNCVSDKSLEEVPKEYLEGYVLFDFNISSGFVNQNGIEKKNIVDTSFGYEAMQLIAGAAKKCKQVDNACIYKELPLVKKYSTVLKAKGFDGTRNLAIDTSLYEIKDKKFVEVK